MKHLLLLCLGIIVVAGCIQSNPADTESTEKLIARTMIHTTAQGLAGLAEQASSTEELIKQIRAYIAPIRFFPDSSGYFYVYDYDCVNIAHATQPDFHGKDLSQRQDSHGLFIGKELSKVARSGGGFVEFYWVKPGSSAETKKLGYVEPIPGTNYYIGTGVYRQ